MGNTTEQKIITTTRTSTTVTTSTNAQQQQQKQHYGGSGVVSNEGVIARDGESPGCTALMYACQQGDVVQVEKLLKINPALARDKDRTLKTALHYCTEARTAQCADLVYRAAPDLINAADEDGLTPLHLAVIAGNIPLTNFLLANNADVKVVDNEKHTVVHWATVCGETAALRAVLLAGAPVSTPDVHGGFPVHYAAQMCGAKDTLSSSNSTISKDNVTSEKRVQSADRDTSKLGLEILDTLLTFPGIRVNAEDVDGRQPLLWAASAGSAAAVLALVAAGSATEAADKDGLTALHCAASRGHADCLEALLTMCGVSPDIIDTNGCTALHYAVTLGHADCTALLLAHGAKVNRQDRRGRTPAHCGCAKGQVETVRMLGANNADLWIRSARGDLPLHEASSAGRKQLVRWLLTQRPSQVNAKNNDGRTPLHFAALNDNTDVCKILLDHGANVNAVMRTSKNVLMTPLDCALKNGFRSTAKYLQLNGGLPFQRLRLPSSNEGGTVNVQLQNDITIQTRMKQVELNSNSEDDLFDETHLYRKAQKRRVYKHRRKIQMSDGGDELRLSHDPSKSQKKSNLLKNDVDISSSSSGSLSSATSIKIQPVRRVKTKTKEIQTDERFLIIPIENSESFLQQEKIKNGQNIPDIKNEKLGNTQKSGNIENKFPLDNLPSLTDSNVSDTNSFDHVKVAEVQVHANQDDGDFNQIEINEDGNVEEINEDGKVEETKQEVTEETEEIIESNKDLLESESKENVEDTEPAVETVEETVKETELGNAAVELGNDVAEEIAESIQDKLYSSEKDTGGEIKEKNESIEQDQEKEILPQETNVEEVEDSSNKQNQFEDNFTGEDINNERVINESETVPPIPTEQTEHTEEMKESPKEVETGDNSLIEETKGSSNESPELEDTKIGENEDSNKIENEEPVEKNEINEQSSTESKELVAEIENEEIRLNLGEESATHDDGQKIEESPAEDGKEEIDDRSKEVIEDIKDEDKVEVTALPTEEVGTENIQDEEKEENEVLNVEIEEPNNEVKENDVDKNFKSFQVLPDSTPKKHSPNDKSKIDSNLITNGSQTILDRNNKKTKSKSQREYKKSNKRKESEISTNQSKQKLKKESTVIAEKLEPSKLSPKNDDDVLIDGNEDFDQYSSFVSDDSIKDNDAETEKQTKLHMKHQILESTYSDESDLDHESYKRNEARKRRSKIRSKSAGKESYHSDGQMLDSGFEPSPRNSRIPRRKCSSKPEINMTTVTQTVQGNIRRYHLERKLFQHLLELKRLQIRSGQSNEAVLVKRAIDEYHRSILSTVGAGRYKQKDYTFKSFEKFLYESLRKLQKGHFPPHLAKLPETSPSPLLCTHSTMNCDHATHAYTGIPCAAYITKLNHHTIPKVGFGVRPGGFLPKLSSHQDHAHNDRLLSQGSVTLELTHGGDKQFVTLPADRLDQNKKYFVTFTVKGLNSNENNDGTAPSHRHAKSC